MAYLSIPGFRWKAQTDRLYAPGRDDSLALFFGDGATLPLAQPLRVADVVDPARKEMVRHMEE
jgi:hypothetical protein